MTLRLSKFGERFTRLTGSLELMDDLGRAMSGESEALMLGGGNPGKVPAVHRALRARLREVAEDGAQFDRMLANYAHPAGELRFRRALAGLLAREFGWDLSERNIALTAGSQAGFFLLFNLLAGAQADGGFRRILLPVTPEYVGYSDLGIDTGLFVARRPRITQLDEPYFKYGLDFDALDIDASIAAVCVSRPTNPTGNVLTNTEIATLDRLCREHDVPLIIDNAYGLPFPSIVFVDAAPIWNDNIILCMSLSKLGLPGARTGIVIANEEIVDALTRATAIASLAVGSVGPVLVEPLVESGEIISLSREFIAPYYRGKAERACALLIDELRGVPFRLHKPEGAFFLWLWFPELPMTSAELYRRLKAAGVYVLSGHYFFPGLAGEWEHKRQCLRVSYALQDEIVADGIRLLAREIKALHSG